MLLTQNLGPAPRTPYELPWGDARVEGVTLTVRGLPYASPTAAGQPFGRGTETQRDEQNRASILPTLASCWKKNPDGGVHGPLRHIGRSGRRPLHCVCARCRKPDFPRSLCGKRAEALTAASRGAA